MTTIPAATLVEQLHWRYATKKFDSTRKLSDEDWAILEQATLLSPSSYGMQPWRFTIITSPEMKQTLTPASHGQTQIADCSHLVVFAVRTGIDAAYVEHYIDYIAQVRSVPVANLAEYRQRLVSFIQSQTPEQIDNWASKQVYIALGFLLSSAALLGIDACPMEGIDSAKYNEILGLKAEGFSALCVAAVGYRAVDDPAAKNKKVRFPADEVVKRIA